jgi:hypothetical protein
MAVSWKRKVGSSAGLPTSVPEQLKAQTLIVMAKSVNKA